MGLSMVTLLLLFSFFFFRKFIILLGSISSLLAWHSKFNDISYFWLDYTSLWRKWFWESIEWDPSYHPALSFRIEVPILLWVSVHSFLAGGLNYKWVHSCTVNGIEEVFLWHQLHLFLLLKDGFGEPTSFIWNFQGVVKMWISK